MVTVDEEDGTNVLYCNARSPLGHRVQAISLDDGAVFQEGQLVQRLVESRNGCHGSIVGFPAPLHLRQTLQRSAGRCRHWTSITDSSNTVACSTSEASTYPSHDAPPDFLTPTWVVYSHPTWATARKDLGVFLSLRPRDPDSWRGPWVIYEGPSAYSDLTYLELSPSPGAPPVVAFACLFECGTKSAYDEICFSIFTLYELIDNLPENVEGTGGTGRRQESRSSPAVHQVPRVKKRKTLMKMCSVC